MPDDPGKGPRSRSDGFVRDDDVIEEDEDEVFDSSGSGRRHNHNDCTEAELKVQVVPTLGICPSPRESASICWTPAGALLFGKFSAIRRADAVICEDLIAVRVVCSLPTHDIPLLLTTKSFGVSSRWV